MHPVTEKEAKTVTVLFPGSEEVRMYMNRSAVLPKEVFYAETFQLPISELLSTTAVPSPGWPCCATLNPSFHLDALLARLTVNLLPCFFKSCCTNFKSLTV